MTKYLKGRYLVAVVALAIVTIVAGTSAAARDNGRTGTPGFDAVSNHGADVTSRTQAGQRHALGLGAGSASVRFLGNRADVAFYEAVGADGGTCYATGPAVAAGAEGKTLGGAACPRAQGGGETFPSARYPVLDLSTYEFVQGSAAPQLTRLAGVAADGVATVAVVDANGQLHAVPIRNNLYGSDIGAVTPSALVALNAGGKEVFRMALTPQP